VVEAYWNLKSNAISLSSCGCPLSGLHKNEKATCRNKKAVPGMNFVKEAVF
jgi:hypothetical protein